MHQLSSSSGENAMPRGITCTLVSRSEQRYILDGCRDDCRQDGRSRNEVRCYSIVGGGSDEEGQGESSSSSSPANRKRMEEDKSKESHVPLVMSNGSARLVLATGETHILCSVKAELVQPAINHPSVGVVELYVDSLQPRSGGGGSSGTAALESTLTHLLVPHLVDINALCIVPHHFVWKLHIDLFLIATSGGSLVDACSHVIFAALQNTQLPLVTSLPMSTSGGSSSSREDGGTSNKPALQVDGDLANAYTIPGISNAPKVMTVTVLKCPAYTLDNNPSSSQNARKKPITTLLLDATLEEEACAFARVHVAMTRPSNQKEEPTICALQKAGGGSLPFGLLQDVIAFALQADPSKSALAVTAEEDSHLLQQQFVLQ